MPEGIEVYVLSKVLKNIGVSCLSCGKHLLVKDPHTGKLLDISFGLLGRIHITKDLNITKIYTDGKPCGSVVELSDFQEVVSKLGIDWMTSTRDELIQCVNSWGFRKKQIGSLLVDQSEIAGIGKFWVGVILEVAHLNKTIKSNLLNFLNVVGVLVDAMIKVREVVLENYMNSIQKDEIKFVNEWYKNLYTLRIPISNQLLNSLNSSNSSEL
jgi:formamidopyrimidine-DNA glycosylase